MIAFDLLGRAAWSPGIESPEAWVKWAQSPEPLAREGVPDVAFLPPLLRRRCDPLGRMMLFVAHATCPGDVLAEVPTVFASRHGAFETMVGMLEALARDEALSPARFSHSVHNTHSGLFSIWTGNQAASTSIAAGAETFSHGLLEACCVAQRDPERSVLFVFGDAAIPEPVRPICDHDEGALALALWIRAADPDTQAAPSAERLVFTIEEGDPSDLSVTQAEPEALAFLRWLESDGTELGFARGRARWCWRRARATR